MKTPRWIAASCAVLGLSDLSGQTTVNVSGSVGSSGAVGVVNVVTPAVAVSVTGATTAQGSASGTVTVAVGGAAPANSGTPTVEPPRAPTPSDARITNLSTRARVASDLPLVTGFAISGDGPRTVLVRAVGPTLGLFGVVDTLAAPHLKLHDANGAVLMENAGWSGATTVAGATAEAGAFPLANGSADSALVVTLAPGTYSVEVSDDASRGGVVLTEVYDVQKTATGSHLTNVSTRNAVAPAGGEFISGFVVSGTESRDFLVRGVGPALTKFNVGGVLRDPALTLFNGAGTPIATNDNWSGLLPATVVAVPATGTAISAGGAVTGSAGAAGVAAAVAQAAAQAVAQGAAQAAAVVAVAASNPIVLATAKTGAFALDPGSADAALVVSLKPGAYTVQLNGTNATSGVALLEIYELP